MNNKKKIGLVLIGLSVVGLIVYFFMQQAKKVSEAQAITAETRRDNKTLGNYITRMIKEGKPAPTTYRPGANSATGVGQYL